MSAAANEIPSSDIFQTKYDEFADELLATLPELTVHIRAAVALDEKERLVRWQSEIKTTTTDQSANPGTVLPGVIIPDSVWASLSQTTKSAIWEFLQLLSMCCFFETGFTGAHDASPPAWMEDAMKTWKTKLESVDFESLMGKFSSFFKFDTDASGSSSAFPQLPEKFLKGQIAKLAEEIVKDIKPEDLGLTPEVMEECEKSPSRAFDILIQLFTKNPAIIQKTIQRIGKRLQQKVQSGAIRPQEIAKEAEELMKEFASNTEFGGLLGSLKGMFGGAEDEDLTYSSAPAGSNARLAAVKERLRKKAEAKKATVTPASTASSTKANGGITATKVAVTEPAAAGGITATKVAVTEPAAAAGGAGFTAEEEELFASFAEPAIKTASKSKGKKK